MEAETAAPTIIIAIKQINAPRSRLWGICKFVNIHPGWYATNFRSNGWPVKIWWVISCVGSPSLQIRFDQNLGDSKIGPLVPFFRGPPHPEFESYWPNGCVPNLYMFQGWYNKNCKKTSDGQYLEGELKQPSPNLWCRFKDTTFLGLRWCIAKIARMALFNGVGGGGGTPPPPPTFDVVLKTQPF